MNVWLLGRLVTPLTDQVERVAIGNDQLDRTIQPSQENAGFSDLIWLITFQKWRGEESSCSSAELVGRNGFITGDTSCWFDYVTLGAH